MSLNIPPAKGVTPEQAAKRLRVIIKDALRGGGPSNSLNIGYERERGKVSHQRAFEYIDMINILLSEIDADVQNLHEVSKKRRPSETRMAVAVLRDKISMRRLGLNEVKMQNQKLYNRFDAVLNVMEGGGGGSPDLKEAYALVQVLPTIAAPPGSKVENTLRAIMAIVKAHYGVIEGGPEQLPAAVSHVLAEIFEEDGKPSLLEDLWLPVHAPYGSVVSVADQLEADPGYPMGPFWIGTNQLQNHNSLVHECTKSKGYEAAEDGPGSILFWNGGVCDWASACAAFRAFCAYFSGGKYTLTETPTKKLLAERVTSNQPIIWHVAPQPKENHDENVNEEGSGESVTWQKATISFNTTATASSGGGNPF